MPNKDQLPERLLGLRERGDGLRTPDPDYFARLTERTLRQAAAPPPAPARLRRLRPWLAAAAVVLLLVCGWLIVDPAAPAAPVAQAELPSSEQLLAEISAEAIENYIGDDLDAFETELYDQEVTLND